MSQFLAGLIELPTFQSLIGVLLGALITWLFADYYYIRASRDLYRDVDKLKNLNILMLRAQELNSDTKFARDNEGNPSGIAHNASGVLAADSAIISSDIRVNPNDKS